MHAFLWLIDRSIITDESDNRVIFGVREIQLSYVASYLCRVWYLHEVASARIGVGLRQSCF